jgi:APA family basic amino acid/polyamine antiporter
MARLLRQLSGFDLTMIAIGSTIGSGIFLTPSSIAQSIPDARWILLVWTVGGITAVCGALTFAELSALMPGAGGLYVYLERAYGGMWGFLFGWAYLLVVNTGGIAALSVASATYFSYVFSLHRTVVPFIAIGGLAVVTLLNIYGVKAGGMFSDIFTVAKLAAIAGLIAIGFGWGGAITHSASPFPFSAEPITLAMIGVLWSYGGWQHATFAAAEARDPGRTVPRAMIVGTGAVMLVYICTNIAYLRLLSPAEMASSSGVAAEAVGRVLGTPGGILIAVAIFVSTFGTTGIFTLTAPRIYFAMAADGRFFPGIATIHPRYSTPAAAIAMQSLWALVLIMYWRTFENLISYVVFTDWIFFGLAGASIFVFRKRVPGKRTYRTPLYPWVPGLFVAVALWFVIVAMIEKPAHALAGLLFLASGIPVYAYWQRRRR